METANQPKRAFLFPGQGAQTVGMGKDIYERYADARRIYDRAEEISGMPIKQLCFEGPEELLKKTENTQMAIFITSLAILEVLKQNGISADVVVGLSLGEYTALVYAGIISFEDGVKLIQKRGYYMGNLVPAEYFSMAAVIGLESSKIEEIFNQISGFVVPANYNYSNQTVISGNTAAVDEAIEKLKQAGAGRVVKLNTGGPFHTAKLNNAKESFAQDLQKVKFYTENIDDTGANENVRVIKNIDGTFYKKEDNLKEILANHIVSPVRFDKSIRLMYEQGIEEFVEIGPGNALSGFVKKEHKDANVCHINNVESLENFLTRVP